MTQICNYTLQLTKTLSHTIALPALAGIAVAVACHQFATSFILSFITSAIVVPFIVSAVIISLFPRKENELEATLYSKSYAIGMLGIAMILQRNLPFIVGGAAVAYWVIPKVLVLKMGYDLFKGLEEVEFRAKPPSYHSK